MGRKVLIVDDEEVIRKFLKINLLKWGYEVQEAMDGVQALEELTKDTYHLLISDVLMPKKNGWELLKAVRANPRTRDMLVMLLTAKNEDADMFQGYELGANYYMTKPFTKDQLLFGLKMMFGEK